MQGGILALFGVCLALGMGELLLPDGNGESTKRLLRFLSALVILVLILAPFAGFLKNHGALFERKIEFEEEDTTDYERIFTEAVTRQSGEDLKAGLCALLQKEYGVAPEHCSVSVFFTGSGELSRVLIFLSGPALTVDPARVENDLSARLGCTVEVR